MKGLKFILFFLFFLICCGLAPYNNITYKIIVNQNNPIGSLKKKEVSKLFLKKTKKWDDGKDVLPIDLLDDSPVRELFTKEIHKKKVRSVKSYWQKQIFSGRLSPPPEKASDEEILEYIQNNENAIGYISGQTPITDYAVKVVEIVE